MASMQVPQQGWSQMTAAQRQIIAGAAGTMRAVTRRSGKRRASSGTGARKKPRKRSASSKRRTRSTAGKKPWMVKGSKAAKARMAKLRKMRRG